MDTLKKYLTLKKDLDELKKTVHAKVSLSAAVSSPRPSESVGETIIGIATETVDIGDIIYVWHNSVDDLVPKISKYSYATATTRLIGIGICLQAADVDEPSLAQMSGTNMANVTTVAGSYGAVTGFRVGCGLRPSQVTAGMLEFLEHDDVEEPSFLCLDDASLDDDVVFVKILQPVSSYKGPFKGSIASTGTSITIGYDRAFVASATQWDYSFGDRIHWRYNSQTIAAVRATAESVAVGADNTYVYYLVVMAPTTLLLTVTLKASTTYPLDLAEAKDLFSRVVILGKARYAGSRITSWSQFHYGQILIESGNYQSQYGLFPVDVVKQSGYEGDATTICSFLYDVKILGEATVIGTNLAPIWNRPTAGKMVQGTSGVAYVNSSDAVVLYQVDEVPFVTVCT